MTPEFEAALRVAGWAALARSAFNLQPAEAKALALLVERRGVPVAVHQLAAYQPDGARITTGSHFAIRKRIERVRSRLADVGCGGTVEAIAEHPTAKIRAYRVSKLDAARIERALVFACGLEPRLAA